MANEGETTTKQQNLAFGGIFLVIGLGVALALDPWFLAVPFIVIGALRLFSAAQMGDDPTE